jgi:5'-methylthioadenosine phosphorylase
VAGVEVVFLARHGRGHVLLPSEINYRANILGLRQLGVERVVSVAACGSFREEIAPRDIVLVDQFVDRTSCRHSHQTFFGAGIAAHIAFADPICPDLRRLLTDAAAAHLATLPAGPDGRHPRAHPAGTYLNMEGPAFSTRAESFLYKSWGMDVVGMTNLTEARLAREAELCYCTMAMVTDYDSWHGSHESVSVEVVVRTLQENAAAATAIIRQSLPCFASVRRCSCGQALAGAVITAPAKFPPATRRRLDLLLGKYFRT